ncbi:hypothetical protein R3W88_011030 [Solanum pinnatisectum]|uniref:Uncharacterized protein n=1 Tax=Solanum pinnatisectum TaxID=50273 RepID=A0AAV9L627_9SOLN|nr:hypothetical protein R3W88_011030 [Solanum pinnatisectum]
MRIIVIYILVFLAIQEVAILQNSFTEMWPMAVSVLRPAPPPPPPPEAADKSGQRSSPTPSETLLV